MKFRVAVGNRLLSRPNHRSLPTNQPFHDSMKIFFLLLLGLSLILRPTTVFSQTTLQMKQQAGKEFDKADAELNKAYKKLLNSLGEEGKKRLVAAQKAWIAFRDAQAKFDCHHLDGGTLEGLEEIGSMTMLTEERTKRLLEDYKRFKEM